MQHINSVLRFLAWPTVCGLLIALLALQFLQLQALSKNTTGIGPQSTLSYAAAVTKTAPSVVNIYTSKVIRQQIHPFFNDPIFKHFFSRGNIPQQERIQRSLGSGVIVSKEGYILTNHHVIQGATKILVALYDGRETFANLVGSDPDTDLAILQIDLPDLSPAPVSDKHNLRVGDVVLAIGNPFGFEQTVTQGIISATGRYGLQLNTYENFIQTDAAINPGNSGGALIDVQGNLIGINSAIWSKSGGSQGIGLAIPIDTASKVLLDIVQYGRVIRGWLGVEGRQFRAPSDLKELPHNGIIITATHPSGPAAKAGLLPGDLIIALNDKPIQDAQKTMQQVAQMRPDTKIRMVVVRDGTQHTIDVYTQERPPTP
jgi:serine protease DegS